MILMSPEERQNIINGLKDCLNQTQNDYNRMPIVIKNENQRVRKRELEDKIEKLENDIEKFSRNEKIWIKADSSAQEYAAQKFPEVGRRQSSVVGSRRGVSDRKIEENISHWLMQ